MLVLETGETRSWDSNDLIQKGNVGESNRTMMLSVWSRLMFGFCRSRIVNWLDHKMRGLKRHRRTGLEKKKTRKIQKVSLAFSKDEFTGCPLVTRRHHNVPASEE